MISYKNSVSLSSRVDESNRIIANYPNHVPIIIICNEELSKIIKKKKYLIHKDCNVSYLLKALRGKIIVDNQKAFFIFSDNIMLCPSDNIKVLYDNYINKNKLKYNDDRFFYITISMENTFG